MNAYRLPRSSDAEQVARRHAIDEAMRTATEAPMEMIRACERAMREAEVIATSGAASAASDAAVGIELLKTAARSAGLNVDTNLTAVKDAEFVKRISQEQRDLEQAIEELLPSGS
jgi:formiminotetrahydrofolate cyclodeaminase